MTGMLKHAMALLLTVSLFSCASSRFQDGFSYRPAHAGPDMGSDQSVQESLPPTPAPATSSTISLPITEAPALNAEEIAPGQKAELRDMVEYGVQAQQEGSRDLRLTVRNIAGTYAAKNNIQYTERQLKKLDRIAVKMEKQYKKKMGPNVTWGPSNNLEWAILGAAAVGLFVGIFGISFGWFIFLVAALAYLYFKLLHNN